MLELLPRVLTELGVLIPPRDTHEAKVEATKEFAGLLLQADIIPKEAAGDIYRLFLPKCPDEVYPFRVLDDEYPFIGSKYTTRSEAQIDAAVMDAAREFLSGPHGSGVVSEGRPLQRTGPGHGCA